MKAVATSKQKYGKDAQGKEVLLQEPNIPVAMEWEKPYLEACINTLNPHGKVLEVGFGLGYAADRIQAFLPQHHLIIESSSPVIARAQEWSSALSTVEISEGSWKESLASFDTFDAIFFGEYSVNQLLSPEEGRQLFAKAQKAQEDLSNAFKELSSVQFSDEELYGFSQTVLKRPNVTLAQVEAFLTKLVNQGNISNKQKESCLKELKKQVKGEGKRSDEQASDTLLNPPLISFIQYCLDHHMDPGSRLSARVLTSESLRNHPAFAQEILARKDVVYTEKMVSVAVPENCPYFQGKQVVVFVIEKK